MTKLTIDLGKGVTLCAPINLTMTYDEWERMTAYIDGIIKKGGVQK